MKAKYIVIPLAIIFGAGLYVSVKTKKLVALLPYLKAFPVAVKNIGIRGGQFKANFDLKIFNTSSDNFNADGLTSFLKKVLIYSNSKLIATILVDRQRLNIPANGSAVIKNLSLEISLAQTLLNINTFLKIKSPDDLTLVPVVEILGKEITI